MLDDLDIEPSTLLYGGGIVVLLLGLVVAGFFLLEEPPKFTLNEETGCLPEDHIVSTSVVAIDMSLEVTEAQTNDVKAIVRQAYNEAPDFSRVEIYTTEEFSARLLPKLTVCKLPKDAGRLKDFDIDITQQRLNRIQGFLFEDTVQKFIDGLGTRMKANVNWSPILELIQRASRIPNVSRIRIISDGYQNSRIAQFGMVPGDLPRYAAFVKRDVYERVKPNPLNGVVMSFHFLELPGYLELATLQELKDFMRGHGEFHGATYSDEILWRGIK